MEDENETEGSGWKTCSVRLKVPDWERARDAGLKAGMVSDHRGVGLWLRKAILDALDALDQQEA